MNNLHNIPPQLKLWLDYQNCLTDKVKALGHRVEVCLLCEVWENGFFRREVVIVCDNTPCWYGKTIIPEQTYQILSSRLMNLNDKPIGHIIYNDSNITLKRRHLFQIKQSSLKYSTHLKSLAPNNLLWTRGSTFQVKDSSLYLIEAFLPSFTEIVDFKGIRV